MNIIRLLLIGGLLYVAIQQKKESTRNILLVVTGLLAVCMLNKEGFIIDASTGATDSTSCTATESTQGTCEYEATTSQTTETGCTGTWTEPCTDDQYQASEAVCTGTGSLNDPDSTGAPTVDVCSWDAPSSSCGKNAGRAADYTSTCTATPPSAQTTQSECTGSWTNPCTILDPSTCTSTAGCSSSSTKTLSSLFAGADGTVVDGTTITVGSNTYTYNSTSTDPITSLEQLASRFTCSGGGPATAIPDAEAPANRVNIIDSPPAEPVNLENYISCPSSGTTPSPSPSPARAPSSTPSPPPSVALPFYDFSNYFDGNGNYVIYGITALALFVIIGLAIRKRKKARSAPVIDVNAIQQAVAGAVEAEP